MRVSKIHIQNFRSLEDVTLNVEDYTCLVGPNGSGKSTILTALDVFFRNSKCTSTDVTALRDEDFHNRNISDPVMITLTFCDMGDEARNDLRAYIRQGVLVVSAKAVWDEQSRRAPVLQFGSRLVMNDLAPFFAAEKEKAKVAELRTIYGELQSKEPELPKVSTKSDMIEALRAFEEAHPEKCELIESNDQFYGWSKGSNRLERHIQWVHVPAVKDASTEQEEGRNSALGQLLERTIRAKVSFDEDLRQIREGLEASYEQMVKAQEEVLQDVSTSLERRLRQWSSPRTRLDLGWHYDPEKSFKVDEPLARVQAGEGRFLGEIARLGHGLQRSFIVCMLHELAEGDQIDKSTLLLSIEEPELYQHPPQARHMASTLESLTDKGNQVIVSTHSPYFISGKGFEGVRRLCMDFKESKARISWMSHKRLSDDLAEALGEAPCTPTSMMARVQQILKPSQNELFFSTVPVLVEGGEDSAFISTHLHLSDRWSEFRQLGCHLVECAGKRNMSRLVAIARGLAIPFFAVFDGDRNCPPKEKKQNARDNLCILRLCGSSISDPSPKDILWDQNVVVWPETIMKSIIPDFGTDEWDEAEKSARKEHGLEDGVKRKNNMLIAATLEELWNKKKKSAVLDELCDKILAAGIQVAEEAQP